MNRINNPVVKDEMETTLKSYKVFTYIELPDNFNKEKKSNYCKRLIPIFYKLCIELMNAKLMEFKRI